MLQHSQYTVGHKSLWCRLWVERFAALRHRRNHATPVLSHRLDNRCHKNRNAVGSWKNCGFQFSRKGKKSGRNVKSETHIFFFLLLACGSSVCVEIYCTHFGVACLNQPHTVQNAVTNIYTLGRIHKITLSCMCVCVCVCFRYGSVVYYFYLLCRCRIWESPDCLRKQWQKYRLRSQM